MVGKLLENLVTQSRMVDDLTDHLVVVGEVLMFPSVVDPFRPQRNSRCKTSGRLSESFEDIGKVYHQALRSRRVRRDSVHDGVDAMDV